MNRSSRRETSLSGKVVLITGGARGIGAATTALLIARGARVAVIDRDPAEPAQAPPDRLLSFRADVTDSAAVQTCVAATVEQWGGLDVVIANAGITPPPATVRTVDRDTFDHVMEVNFGGVLTVARASVDHIVERGGHIAVVSSCAAFTPGMGGSAYMISKAAVEQLGRALSIEMAAVGASAGVAYFGIVDTELARGTLDEDPLGRRIGAMMPWPLSRRLSGDRAAHLLVRSVTRRRARIIAPRAWLLYFWLRGIVNPVLERRLRTDRSLHRLLRDVESKNRSDPKK